MASPRQAAVRVADRLVESLCKAPGVGSGRDAELVAMKLREAPRDGPSTAIELLDELGRNARRIFAISHGQQCRASPLESRQFSRQAFDPQRARRCEVAIRRQSAAEVLRLA